MEVSKIQENKKRLFAIKKYGYVFGKDAHLRATFCLWYNQSGAARLLLEAGRIFVLFQAKVAGEKTSHAVLVVGVFRNMGAKTV